jgi:Ca2+-binding EF-hand superfamily protein
LERGADAGARHWEQQLANGNMTVREVVRNLVTSQEYTQRFGQTEAGEGTPYERAVARLYRHVLARQPDAEGQRHWAQTAQQRGLPAVVDALLNSQEYSNNFGDWGVPGSGGVTFCAPNNASARNQTPARQVGEPRFRVMDSNNDGVITRNEWRGNARSFRVHDWDGNGVLEGNEVRAGAFRQGSTLEDEDFDRNEQFEWLDANNNNRIERREWHLSLDAFNRLDANRDGNLSRNEVRFVESAAVGTTGETVIVDSSVRWTDTGINVRAGETLRFDVIGQVRLSDNPGDVADQGGTPSARRAANAPVRNAPAGGLIARIGNGQPVYVGERRAVRAPSNGRLYLGVNDDYLADNEGQYQVSIDIR